MPLFRRGPKKPNEADFLFAWMRHFGKQGASVHGLMSGAWMLEAATGTTPDEYIQTMMVDEPESTPLSVAWRDTLSIYEQASAMSHQFVLVAVMRHYGDDGRFGRSPTVPNGDRVASRGRSGGIRVGQELPDGVTG